MLGKLLKYEIKATSRIFLPIYLVLTVFALINHFMAFNSDNFTKPQAITFVLYMIILVGMFIASFIVMIQRFYKNLLSEEGYLMFTLPVNSWKHILSKILVTVMWIISSSIVAFMSIIIIVLQEVSLTELFTEFGKLWTMMSQELGGSVYHILIIVVVGSIVSIVHSIMLIYVSIALGHLSNNHKILASVGSFLGVYTITSIISGMIVSNKASELLLFGIRQDFTMPFGYMWTAIGLSALFATVYFIVTNLVLSKRLNLE